ncbi:MAG: hypothetical protein HQL78_13295 [Magnetococcales bacterium]|nr:hypothetical protein [Magnetococcales bacterium]
MPDSMWFKRIISTQYTGLCNRLEGLALCFAVQELFGHAVCLDWPETAWLQVEGARRWKYNPLDKLFGTKIRDPDAETFYRLGHRRILIQRGTMGGDPAIVERVYHDTMARLHLRPESRDRLLAYLAAVGNALLVGVHIRRGDFQGGDGQTYDIHSARHPQVPTWWYGYAMERVQRQFGNVLFLLCHNNLDAEEERALRQRFPVLPSLADGRYNSDGGHASTSNPVLDLFALACCPILIATPMSTFSHCAANVLGPPSLALQPLPVMQRTQPGLGVTTLYGHRSPAWFTSLREQTAFAPLAPDAAIPDPGCGVHCKWL